MERILREATEHGALGAVLSGAGPTLLLLARSEESANGNLVAFVEEVMAQEGVKLTTRWLEPCLHGPLVQIVDGNDPEYKQEPHQILGTAEVGA
jgi:homoserine kinase